MRFMSVTVVCILSFVYVFKRRMNQREVGGRERQWGQRPERATTLFSSSVSFFFSMMHSPLYLLQAGEEEQEAVDRCAGCETTPLYMSFLKGVSPGGACGRENQSYTRLNLFLFGSKINRHTLSSQYYYYCGLSVGRKEGREGGRERVRKREREGQRGDELFEA